MSPSVSQDIKSDMLIAAPEPLKLDLRNALNEFGTALDGFATTGTHEQLQGPARAVSTIVENIEEVPDSAVGFVHRLSTLENALDACRSLDEINSSEQGEAFLKEVTDGSLAQPAHTITQKIENSVLSTIVEQLRGDLSKSR
jgi:hypothetical protein